MTGHQHDPQTPGPRTGNDQAAEQKVLILTDGQGYDLTDMAERTELLRGAQRALEEMPTDRLRSAVEQFAGAETIQQALRARSERNHQARQWFDRELDQARARDPHEAAKAEAWARRALRLPAEPEDAELLREVDDDLHTKYQAERDS